ncbi:hypothetical protein [Micromonospora sp. WMMD987]|uniref:hypothetical protein n=1 Tax=Micromonospora sp. WMMD987 TaxID=3016089 RepID=UPI00249C596D|nr:hypothetical protein [Micromonospora sp. WMMD987]WFE97172.1 hypothetical protein O7612_10040 [Micromonospora sp. WMMD987]
MAVNSGLLRRIVGRCFSSSPVVSGVGERIQAVEQEAARRRLLDLAHGMPPHPATGRNAISSKRRVPYDGYLSAAALTLARRHRQVWSWRTWSRLCRCGADLPCHARHRLPISRGHWPTEEEQ